MWRWVLPVIAIIGGSLSFVASQACPNRIMSTDDQGRNVNSCCPTLREFPRNDRQSNRYIGINNDTKEIIQHCSDVDLVFNIEMCYCDWNDVSKSRIGPCPAEFRGPAPDPPTNEYHQWNPVAHAYAQRHCTDVLPPCARIDSLMYFDFTDCRCYMSASYFHDPTVIYCTPSDPCYHGVDAVWSPDPYNPDNIVISNLEGTYIDNWRPVGSDYWPIPWEEQLPEGSGKWIIDEGNYIRDAYLTGNSGPNIRIQLDICVGGGNGLYVVMSDGCLTPNDPSPQASPQFYVGVQVQGNRNRFCGTINGADFCCPRIRKDCVMIDVDFCKGYLSVSVQGEGDDSPTTCTNADSITHSRNLFLNEKCPFTIGFDPFDEGTAKFTGTISDFDVWKDCDDVCTPWTKK